MLMKIKYLTFNKIYKLKILKMIKNQIKFWDFKAILKIIFL